MFPVPYHLFGAGRNNLGVSLLARISNRTYWRAEHYEMTRYDSLIGWAEQPGRNDCATVLQKTLDEERATDRKPTTLAESRINLRAAS